LQGKLVFWENGCMKTTIELPDDLLTEVKIEAARQHKKLKELVPDLVRAGLRANRTLSPAKSRDSKQWLEEWVKLGETATEGLPSGPAATEILAADRRRLERR
jgi:Arc/MetJ family transcription regulator